MARLIVNFLSEEAANLKEKILVIANPALQNSTKITPMSAAAFYELVLTSGSYQLRNNDLEKNSNFRQVIPYFVVRYKDKYLFTTRSNRGGEKRLYQRGLVGFGGHVRAEDVAGKDLLSWGERELSEELFISGKKTLTYKGIIVTEIDEVAKFHIGVLIIVDVTNPRVLIKESDKFMGSQWLSLPELQNLKDSLEGWSKLVVESGLI